MRSKSGSPKKPACCSTRTAWSAGANALIRGLNSLTEQRLPVVVVLATNRLGAIDPAVRRRAAATFEFGRPDDSRRRDALRHLLEGIPLDDEALDALVAVTGRTS